MIEVVIRQATSEDAKSLDALSQHLGYAPTAKNAATQRLEAVIQSSADVLWLAEDAHGQVLGWIHVFKALRVASGAFYEIGGLVVDPTIRRRGVGRLLVQKALTYSQKADLPLRVRCNSQRLATHEFYRALGLVENKAQLVFQSPRKLDE